MTWRPGRWTGWFAIAMVLVAAACSEATAEGPQSAGPEVPSPAEGTLTSADGEIMGDTESPGYSVEVPAGWSTLDGHFFVKDRRGRSRHERVGRRSGAPPSVPLEANHVRGRPHGRRSRRCALVAAAP